MHKYWKRVAVGVALSAAVLKLASGPEPATDPNYGACQEDEACWDCSTMGNMICGVRPAGEETP